VPPPAGDSDSDDDQGPPQVSEKKGKTESTSFTHLIERTENIEISKLALWAVVRRLDEAGVAKITNSILEHSWIDNVSLTTRLGVVLAEIFL
jgi:hypothetical protein